MLHQVFEEVELARVFGADAEVVDQIVRQHKLLNLQRVLVAHRIVPSPGFPPVRSVLEEDSCATYPGFQRSTSSCQR